MKYKIKGNSSPHGKPKVYFMGHPQDCKISFESICDMILKLHNCAVFYDENLEKPDDEFLVPGENFNDAIYKAMEKSELFAMVVTPSLLENPNYVISIEYSVAKMLERRYCPQFLYLLTAICCKSGCFTVHKGFKVGSQTVSREPQIDWIATIKTSLETQISMELMAGRSDIIMLRNCKSLISPYPDRIITRKTDAWML